jgi:hypothetical protein
MEVEVARKSRGRNAVCETRRPVDLLPDREADTLAVWLAERPGIEIVCRDRAPFFAEGATRGAPQALQVADRWHLWHNLCEAAEKCVYQHRGCLRPVPASADEPQEKAEPPVSWPWPTGHRFAERTRAKHATIHALLDAGHSKRSVARQLGMTLNTVLRFSRATTPEELFTGQWQSRPTRLDPYKPYLDRRAGRLYQRLETMGGDQETGLPPRLRQRPRLRQQDTARQASVGRAPAAIGPNRHTLDPHPPRRPERDRPTSSQGRPGQLP